MPKFSKEGYSIIRVIYDDKREFVEWSVTDNKTNEISDVELNEDEDEAEKFYDAEIGKSARAGIEDYLAGDTVCELLLVLGEYRIIIDG